MIADKYQICNRCIMDTTDPEIKFDDQGNCNHCNSALELAKEIWFPDEKGEKLLNELFGRIKDEERNKEFDCIIGISGGVDSSYLTWLTVNKGLRPLVVHVDCGWNSEQAVKNVENVIKKLNIELHTFVVNWEEMKDLQRSFLKQVFLTLPTGIKLSTYLTDRIIPLKASCLLAGDIRLWTTDT
jgi:asparagine synthetase B (glutamine-hydrolysing)